jgi:hypothetical protein
VEFLRAARHKIPGDGILDNHRCENLTCLLVLKSNGNCQSLRVHTTLSSQRFERKIVFFNEIFRIAVAKLPVDALCRIL